MLKTKHFGELELTEHKTIAFSEGIPGFPTEKEFILLSEDGSDGLFCWLQSATNGNLAFALMDVFKVIPDYAPQINDFELESLKIPNMGDAVILNVVVIPEDIANMTVNLSAPVVINTKECIGKQIVTDSEIYTVRHNVMEEIENSKKKREGE